MNEYYKLCQALKDILNAFPPPSNDIVTSQVQLGMRLGQYTKRQIEVMQNAYELLENMGEIDNE